MPWVTPELQAEFFDINGQGPVAQSSIFQDAPPPASIAAAGSYNTGVIISNGYKVVAVGVTSSVAGGAISITRYLDRAGTVLATTNTSSTLVAATAGTLVANSGTDGIPFASFVINITNPGATTTLSNFYVLLQAN